MKTVNDSQMQMCAMKQRSLVNTGDISPEIAYIGEYRLRWKERAKEIEKVKKFIY